MTASRRNSNHDRAGYPIVITGRVAAARATGEAAADGGDHARAAELFETAWAAIPARSTNGLNAVSEVLLLDDTARASVLLSRLKGSADSKFSEVATVMLKELEPIEPAAKSAHGDAAEFFRDPGSPEPIHISALVPSIDKTEMELLARPLPKLIQDSEAVVLLASLSAENAEPQALALPVLPEPVITFESAWKEVLSKRLATVSISSQVAPPRDVETVDLSKHGKPGRLVKFTSEPEGAAILLDDRADAVCRTPCDLRVEAGPHTVHLSMPGFQHEERMLNGVGRLGEISVPLTVLRGFVVAAATGPATLRVNGVSVKVCTPAELALIPGLHRISADFGSTTVERVVMVKPGAHLTLHFKP